MGAGDGKHRATPRPYAALYYNTCAHLRTSIPDLKSVEARARAASIIDNDDNQYQAIAVISLWRLVTTVRRWKASIAAALSVSTSAPSL